MNIVVCLKQVPDTTAVKIDPKTGTLIRDGVPAIINPEDKHALEGALQLREKVGIMFGNPETTPGGRALKFYASVRLDIRKTENLKQDGEVFGNRVRVKVVKNKVAPPFREAEFDIIYGKGISKSGNILDLGVNLDIVEKSGSWFAYDGTRIGQGRENAKKYFEENPEIMAEVEKKVRAKFNEAFEKSLSDEMEVDAEQETEPTEEE